MATNDPPAADRCPRCAAAFHCGADDDRPCPCTTIKLDAAALADLRQRYSGCLCLRCLAALSALSPSVGTAGIGGRPA